MAPKNKKRHLTVGREGFDEELWYHFNRISKTESVPSGELMARALYLICLEHYGSKSMRVKAEGLRKYAETSGYLFNEHVFSDKEGWLIHVKELQQEQLELNRIKAQSLDNN